MCRPADCARHCRLAGRSSTTTYNHQHQQTVLVCSQLAKCNMQLCPRFRSASLWSVLAPALRQLPVLNGTTTDEAATEELHSMSNHFLFHDLLLRSYLYHFVWSVITAHNLTPEKRDNNYSPHPLIPTSCLRNNIQIITGISPCCGCL